MKEWSKTVLVCLAIYLIIAMIIFFYNDSEQLIMVGLAGIIFSLIYVVLGIIFLIPVSTRLSLGIGLLISGGLILIIGLSVCSASQWML